MPSGEVECHLSASGTTWRPKIIPRCKLVGFHFQRLKPRSGGAWGLVVLVGEKDCDGDEVGKFKGALSFSVGFSFGTFSLKKFFC